MASRSALCDDDRRVWAAPRPRTCLNERTLRPERLGGVDICQRSQKRFWVHDAGEEEHSGGRQPRPRHPPVYSGLFARLFALGFADQLSEPLHVGDSQPAALAPQKTRRGEPAELA